MDPHSNQVPGLHIPQSSTGPVVQSGLSASDAQAPAQATAPMLAAIPQPQIPSASQQVAEDDDELEALDQDWVNKARDIVEQTKGDPFTQNNELSKIKAGYLKARYNKDINLGEDHSS